MNTTVLKLHHYSLVAASNKQTMSYECVISYFDEILGLGLYRILLIFSAWSLKTVGRIKKLTEHSLDIPQ